MARPESKVLSRFDLKTIREMLIDAGIPEQESLKEMIEELARAYLRRGVVIEHIACSVGLVDEDPFVLASRIKKEFCEKAPLWYRGDRGP